MVPNLCRTKLLPYILGVIRSSIEDARKAERRLDNQIKQLSDQLTINKLQVTDKLGHLLEKEDVDVLHLSKEIAKDAQRDILMTSVALVLISLLIIGAIVARFCGPKKSTYKQERVILGMQKAKAKQPKEIDVESDGGDLEP